MAGFQRDHLQFVCDARIAASFAHGDDPSLQLMVLTKENVAAHAVAEDLVSLHS